VLLDTSTPEGASAERRLREEPIVWLTTVRADGQPQSSAVWFLWDGETFLLYSQPHAQKLRNIAANPRVALHLDDDGRGEDILTLEGTAAVEPEAPPSDRVEDYLAKYRGLLDTMGWTPARLARDFSTAIRVRPSRVRTG
jgi:PPOX class probable F420-dependent enzyme